MRINVDMDGVVYDFVSVLKNRLNSRLNIKLPDPNSWDFGNWPRFRADFHDLIIDEAHDRLFAWGLPIPAAIWGIEVLHSRGHDIRIVTNKLSLGYASGTAAQDAIGFLNIHGLLEKVEVVFASRNDKQGYPADVVIDDNPSLKWAQKGAWNMLFDQPWNQDVTSLTVVERGDHGEIFTAVQRMKDWGDIVEALT